MPAPTAKEVVVWGWLRLILGTAQIGLSAAAVVALFAIGLEPETWVLIGAAMAATCLSRILYRGRRGPQMNEASFDRRGNSPLNPRA